MFRLFVAIELPEPVKTALVALCADIPGARWTSPDSMHLTLNFIGDGLTEGQLTAAKRALDRLRCAPFALALEGVGRFPSGTKPARVLWAGVADSPPLMALQAETETALEDAGFALELRPYQPHITLAWLKLRRVLPELQHFLTAHADLTTDIFPVDHFTLFSSDLTPRGPIYTVQGVYPLEA